MQLEEPFYELDRVKLKRWLPWLALFRAFRLAISPKAILLGCLAILLLDVGFAGLARLPFAEGWANVEHLDRSRWVAAESIDSLSFSWEEAYVQPVASVRDTFAHGWLVLHPISDHVPAAYHLFRHGGGWTGAATAVTALLLCLLVWSLCGVGIARLAAVRFAADQPLPLRDSAGFGLRKLASSTGAVIVPLLAVMALWLGGVILGWLGHIPVIGDVLVGLGWGLAMLAGLLMALILLGLAAGWPLMLASLATEDADAFDAFSRVYSYVFARPWYALFLALLLLLYGSVLIVFAATLLTATHTLTQWAVGAGLGHEGLLRLTAGGEDATFGARAVEAWRNLAGLVLHGFIVSYFWTATTIVYLLLRKSEDATPLDAVTLLQPAAPGDQQLPLVGMPAAERRENEMAAEADPTVS